MLKQIKRHRPLHGATGPIARLTDADDLAGVSEGLLDSPFPLVFRSFRVLVADPWVVGTRR